MPKVADADVKCVKCAENHHTADSSIVRQQPAICANCGEDHPASYWGCPDFAKPRPTSYARTLAPSNTPSLTSSNIPALAPTPALNQTPSKPEYSILWKTSPGYCGLSILTDCFLVLRKITPALAGKTTPIKIITALLSCATDIATLIKPN